MESSYASGRSESHKTISPDEPERRKGPETGEGLVPKGPAILESDMQELRMSISPSKASVLPGEPCVVELTINNKSASEILLDLGADGTEAFSFSLFSAVDGPIWRSGPIRKAGGVARSGKVRINPGDSCTRILVLNRWGTTMVAPGDYDVLCTLRTRDGTGVTASCRIVVANPDQDALSGILSDLADQVLSTRKPLADRGFAFSLLSSSRSSQVVPHLARLIGGTNRMDWQRDLVRALRRIATADAVRELAMIAGGQGRFPESIQSSAIASVYEIHETTRDPAIREACEGIVGTIPRRRAPVIRD